MAFSWRVTIGAFSVLDADRFGETLAEHFGETTGGLSVSSMRTGSVKRNLAD